MNAPQHRRAATVAERASLAIPETCTADASGACRTHPDISPTPTCGALYDGVARYVAIGRRVIACTAPVGHDGAHIDTVADAPAILAWHAFGDGCRDARGTLSGRILGHLATDAPGTAPTPETDAPDPGGWDDAPETSPAFVPVWARRDGVAHHARERAAFTLRDRVRADILAERAATDGGRA